MKNPIKRTIVIPAYAEEKYITKSLNDLYEYLKSIKWLDSTEVVVVTADAPDTTISLVKKNIKNFPQHQHILTGARVGKGRDVKAGLKVAKANLVLFMDADLATPLKYVKAAFDNLERDGGMTIGVRNVTSMHNSFLRKSTSILSNTIIRLIIGWDISDSQCGFKGFDKNALTIILPRSLINGWGFDFEFIKIAKLHNLKISAMDIPDWKDPKPYGTGLAGDPQFSAMIKTFKELFRVLVNQLKGKYR